MSESDSNQSDTLVPRKKNPVISNLRQRAGTWGAVITAIASLGYAEIQREENVALLETNVKLVEIIIKDASVCRETVIKAYNECQAKKR